ncbi:hypothetical protein [Muriicola sp. Z0-33]|uniref:hypothetical protein n=1 Tax=Muriicola sp. Z0-33 TaxID=2816957 RepID=UPI00223906DE|nr:hypothetical protein [Muriicola sp. Z0-33]MCW5518182.1 hypothetical protein [Muriicola sp. Z0-33]
MTTYNKTKIEFLPEGTFGLEKLGKLPVAKISLFKEQAIKVSPLAKHVLNRATSREMYSNVIISIKAWENISKLIGPSFGEIELITNAERVKTTNSILADGMEVETATFKAHEESRMWFRENDEQIALKRDGINLPGVGIKGLKKWIAEWQLSGLKTEVWHDKKSNEYALKEHRERVEKSPNIITLKTTNNKQLDWLRCGCDYAKLQLACSLSGFYMQPLSQVLQEYTEMNALAKKFENIMNIQNNEKVQMALRVGKSKTPYLTYRRKLEDIIV